MRIEMSESDKKGYTKVTLHTNQPILDELEMQIIDNYMHEIASEFSEMVIKDKDLAISQYLIREQEKEIKELKRKLRLHKKTISKLLKQIREMKGKI